MLTQIYINLIPPKQSAKEAKNVTLDELKPGESAVITSVEGETSLRCRLLDMGLIPKTKVTLMKVAPMGDPIEIHIRGYELTLRVGDAEKIGIVKSADNKRAAESKVTR